MENRAGNLRKVIVTGANKGIGYEIVKGLYKEQGPYHIILTARNIQLGEDAKRKIQEEVPDSNNKIESKQLDVNDSKSIQSFITWVQEDLKTFDILVNNAGIKDDDKPPEYRALTLKTNFFSVVELTEKLLPFLVDDGKIIQISSGYGILTYQGENIQEKLNDPNLSRETLMTMAQELLEKTEVLEQSSLGWNQATYHNSKCLLNTYTRWILPRILKENQQCYCCTPGYCRTDMTSPDAPLSAEEGARTAVFLAQLPFVKDEKYHAKFIRKDYTEPY